MLLTKSLFAATLATSASAMCLLGVMEPTVTTGKAVQVQWLTSDTTPLELLLVKKTNNGWDEVQPLFQKKKGVPCSIGNYTWDVNATYASGQYGLWLSNSNYADLTEWFTFVAPKSD